MGPRLRGDDTRRVDQRNSPGCLTCEYGGSTPARVCARSAPVRSQAGAKNCSAKICEYDFCMNPGAENRSGPTRSLSADTRLNVGDGIIVHRLVVREIE